jgi:hypothetical protein
MSLRLVLAVTQVEQQAVIPVVTPEACHCHLEAVPSHLELNRKIVIFVVYPFLGLPRSRPVLFYQIYHHLVYIYVHDWVGVVHLPVVLVVVMGRGLAAA